MDTVNEDFLASDEVLAMPDGKTNEELNCPLCLNRFMSPRQLPCTHSFCEACLQTHISDTVPEKPLCGEFNCPICESKISLPAEYSVEKWASLLPVSTILLYMLLKEKPDGEKMCDACNSENISTQAEGYCLECNDALCAGCLNFHRKQRILKQHSVISISEIITKPENVTKYGLNFRCDVHANETLTHTCRDHLVLLCSLCVTVNHKHCSNVIRLEEERDTLLGQIDLNLIKQNIKKCDDEVTKLFGVNQTNLKNLKSQTKDIINEISNLRKKINGVFDDLEKQLQQNAETIYTEHLIKTQEMDKYCQSLKVANKNTYALFEAVNEHGTVSQKYILARKVKHHTDLLHNKIDKARTQNKVVTLHLEINPKLKWMLAIPTRQVAFVKVRKQDGEFIVADERQPLKGCNIQWVNILEFTLFNKLTNFAYLSQSSIIWVEDNYCIGYDMSIQRCTYYPMPEGYDGASNIFVIGDNEIAILFPTLRAVYLFSVCDSKLSDNGNFKTRHKCSSVVAVSKEDIIVSGYRNDGKGFYWSLVTLDGREKSYHEFDVPVEGSTYIALNSKKTLLYISIRKGNSLYCFDLDGTVYYHITPAGLVSAAGLALDRDDNVYVVGKKSRNILQISPDGEVFKTFEGSIPRSPTGICFNPNGDKFICANKGIPYNIDSGIISSKLSAFISFYELV